MKILSMFFTNYGSFFGEHAFNFADRGIALILGRNLDEPRMKSNGAGKSTLGDALEWCLFGEVPRGDAADSIVNAESGKGTTVAVQVMDDEQRLIQIQRARKVKNAPSGPRVWVDGVEVTKLDADETQRVIEGLLGLDRQVFRAAVLFAQGESFTFADATDAERKEILTKILQLEELDRWAELVDERVRAAEQVLPRIDVASLVTQIQYVGQQNPQVHADAWEADFQTRKDSLQTQLQHATAEVERTRIAVEALAGHVATATLLPPARPQALADLDFELQRVAASRANMEREIGQERGRYKDASARLAAIQEKGTGTCSACGQPITAAHLAHEVLQIQKYLADTEATGKRLAGLLAEEAQRMAELQQKRQSIDAEYQQALQKVAAERAVAQRHAGEANQIRYSHQQAQDVLTRLTHQWGALIGQVNPFLAEIQRREQTLAQLRAQLAEREEQRARLEEELRYWQFWKTGFGPKGLKSYVLDARLDEMSTEANRWVQLLTGGTIWVRFETQKAVGKGKGAKLTEQFSVRVFRHNPDGTITERSFRSWSGGEKHRIALGIDFGLARLIASRAKRSYDLLILDEVFQKSLDGAGKEAVAEMLQHLAHEKSSILVVDHDVIFQGLFEDTIIVEKKNGRSRLVQGSKA